MAEVSCTVVSRCNNINLQHRFTTDLFFCKSGRLQMEFPNVGYTSSIHIPSLTEPLYEMMNPSTGRLLTASSASTDVAVELGYSITNKVTYVFSVPFSSTVPYVLIWNHCIRNHLPPINTLITPLNDEYNYLMSYDWIEMATFYMFPSQSGSGICSLSRDDKSVSHTPSQNFYASCRNFQSNEPISNMFINC